MYKTEVHLSVKHSAVREKLPGKRSGRTFKKNILVFRVVLHILLIYTLCMFVYHRFASSSVDNDKDTDEEINHWSRRCRPERTSEKMQSDWAKMKERLCTLRQVIIGLSVYYLV